MIAESASDFLADFAVSATKNGATAVSGLFDRAYGESFGMVAGNDPVFRCTAGQLARGDTLVVSSTSYTVIGIEPDGTGWDVCRLEEV